MKDRTLFAFVFALAMLALTPLAWPQSTPSYRPPYRPPVKPATSPAATLPAPSPAPAPAAPAAGNTASAPSSTPANIPPGWSVSILQSGGLVAQASISAWLHGNFHLNTSIIVCARGSNQNDPACSPPCKLDEECKYEPFSGPLPQRGPFKLSIIDPDAHSVMVDTTVDPGTCTFPNGCALPVTNTAVYGTGATITIALINHPEGCHGPYASIEAELQLDSFGLEAVNATKEDIEHGYVILRDPSYLGEPSGGYYATPPVESRTMDHGVSVMDFKNDYGRSIDKCPEHSDFAVVATVHTHPQSYIKLNWYFTSYDYTQSVQATSGKATTDGECLPKVLAKEVTSFEEIVMIYGGDREVRTFTPKLGDCAFTTKQMNQVGGVNTVPQVSSLWRRYNDRTCILPWAYLEQADNPAALTKPLPDLQAAYDECKGKE